MMDLYSSIVLLVIYGDIVKRYLPPQTSLAILYVSAILIMVIMYRMKSEKRTYASLSKDERLMNGSTILLIGVYLSQLLTSFNSPFMLGLSHAMYMCIPLLYIVVIQLYCPQFDLMKFGNVYLWLMIPVNIVGWVQYYINPNFLISAAYSGDLGGVILRNLFEGDPFSRYPSIFASADRYSSMGLMHFYFTLVLLTYSDGAPRRNKYWIAFNMASSWSALLIAGARSRILIALAALILMAINYIVMSNQKHAQWLLKQVIIFTIVILIFGVIFTNFINHGQDEMEVFPVITFLQQSYQEGDIYDRIEQALSLSIVSDETTLVGDGLGTKSEPPGKPGEFGVYSIWGESGFIWGSLLLLGYAGMMLTMVRMTCRAFIFKQSVMSAIYSIPLMIIIFALLAGLTSAFELSSGVLLACTLAVITRASFNSTNASSADNKIVAFRYI